MLSLHGSRRPPLLRPGWKRHFHANCMKDPLASRSIGVRSFVSRLGTTAEGNEEALRIDSPWGTPSSPASPHQPPEICPKVIGSWGGGAPAGWPCKALSHHLCRYPPLAGRSGYKGDAVTSFTQLGQTP